MMLESCDLQRIVQGSVERYQSAVPSRYIHFDSSVQKQIWVDADADRLQQALTNYISNALKYSPADKPVRVTLAVEDTIALVRVHDEGPGLPAKRENSSFPLSSLTNFVFCNYNDYE